MTRSAATSTRPAKPRLVHLTTVDMSLALLLLPQLRAFAEAGYDVFGVSAPGPFVDEIEAAGVTHIPLSRSTRSLDVRSDIAAAGEFRRIVHRLRPDIVHTHNPKPGVYGRIVGRLSRVPVVVNTVHGLYAQPSDPLTRRAAVYGAERIAAAFSHAELVQNPDDLRVLQGLGVPARRLHLLGNGIDLARFDPGNDGQLVRNQAREQLGLRPEHIVFGMVGRLVAEKGYLEAFTAMERVARHFPDARFVVVGPHEPDKADVVPSAVIERAEARLPIQFLGMRDDVERLYQAMDVYLLASHREGFPRSAMEAAATGLPLILTDIRGCREVVDHQQNGLLVPARSAPALADAMLLLATDAGLRREYGRRSRRKAARDFDVRRQIDLTLRVYEQLLACKGRRPAG